MHYPTSRKIGENYVLRSNAQDREDIINSMGAEYFEQNHDFDDLREPNIPLYFSFIFYAFLEIQSCSGECITWTDIASYAKMRKIDFSQYEIDLLLKCKTWAENQMSKMREESKG